MTQTHTASKNPRYTVSAQVLASNLIIMGDVPPVVTQTQVDEFTVEHGPEYSGELVAALAGYGIHVDYANTVHADYLAADAPFQAHEAIWG